MQSWNHLLKDVLKLQSEGVTFFFMKERSTQGYSGNNIFRHLSSQYLAVFFLDPLATAECAGIALAFIKASRKSRAKRSVCYGPHRLMNTIWNAQPRTPSTSPVNRVNGPCAFREIPQTHFEDTQGFCPDVMHDVYVIMLFRIHSYCLSVCMTKLHEERV